MIIADRLNIDIFFQDTYPIQGLDEFSKYNKEYIDGIESFLDFANSYGDPHGEKIQCPCGKCCNILWNQRNVVYDHLIFHGFVKGYTRWINHGEWDIKLNVDDDKDYSCDYIDGLLNDQFRLHLRGVAVGRKLCSD